MFQREPITSHYHPELGLPQLIHLQCENRQLACFP